MVGTGTMLDFEDKPSYTVTVTATDPDSASDTISVTVTVGNVDEDGMVTITPDTTPQVGTELTASLEDQDGSVANLTWQWQKDDGQGSYADIPGATMMSYTPVMADDGSRLQATAMYDDSFGEGKTAMGMTANAVGATGDILSCGNTTRTARRESAKLRPPLPCSITSSEAKSPGTKRSKWLPRIARTR